MSKQLALDAMIETSEREQTKPPVFLHAWKDDMVEYFNVTSGSVGQATEKF